jgi:hypothetical protein
VLSIVEPSAAASIEVALQFFSVQRRRRVLGMPFPKQDDNAEADQDCHRTGTTRPARLVRVQRSCAGWESVPKYGGSVKTFASPPTCRNHEHRARWTASHLFSKIELKLYQAAGPLSASTFRRIVASAANRMEQPC